MQYVTGLLGGLLGRAAAAPAAADAEPPASAPAERTDRAAQALFAQIEEIRGGDETIIPRYIAQARDGDGEALEHLFFMKDQGVDVNSGDLFQCCSISAERQSHFALARLAEMHRHGMGCDVNPREAVATYLVLANQGSLEAIRSLIDMHYDGMVLKEEIERTYDACIKLTDASDAAGEYLGSIQQILEAH